ncbi:nitrate reductase (NADPH) niaD or niiA-Penicillium chrysogenum [Penicillium mononematosum]|uniref:nitrate reductase (NADPH) niaD or niiA-Penicillium chrysogenum n=1 Tax=Penicillium mononematosum TaxID=268346 RepID=UPI002549A20A|nr:nitrate reductase (NADPH) niaD or niiA-Penicillium chrysogenum [Penicillium mononematosum]KAJ6180902.1 nitrate reductase (NADPH) niaD or niiA-Penicillium chrysogenum [Penicillium mononematosum]
MASITTQTITEPETISFKNAQITVEDIIPTPGEPDIPLPPPSKNPVDILDLDKGTPDNHVPRDPRLIRLTGVHPFNVEPPLTALYKEGFLTSPELFYVRNHGPVPQVRDEDIPNWEISIEGLVEKPLVLNFREVLQKYDQITAPITLVCAGNRRKEQNTVRKSKGFSWGAAGLSTALFTGPMMADILRSAKPLRQAKYVCMEGADKLPNGFYGTSVKLNWAMDPNRGIMLAHKMNGEDLRPDHGRPLRAVVPGQIGGRSVKWLKKLILTDAPSDNWYHINDNRVLPTMVTPEMSAENRKWWTDERYAIYELNVNSVAVYPQHEEEIDLSTAGPTYTVKGYAYAGGGRRITKVEVSLDRGKSWRLSEIEYAEDKYRDFDGELFGGKVDMWWREASFCWSFWSLDVPVADLETSDAILVRAVDEALSAMPRDMYWSVLGMMNNPWFRVAITKQGNTLKFEHPTHPAKAGGWMERVKKTGGDLLNGNWGERVEGEEPFEPEPVKEINMKKDGVNRQIDLQELKANSSSEKPWFVVNGEVYDGTAFLEGHPGGAISITSSAGLDVSEDFLAIHSETAKAMMPDYHIGTLDKASLGALEDDSTAGSDEARAVFLQSRKWTKATLTEKKDVSWDTRLFVFDLEHEKQTLGLPIGQHLMIKVQDPSNNEAIIRSYTPMSDTNLIGKMDFPLGSKIDCKGPTGRFEYLGNGRVSISGKERHVRSFKMICGGTGITPVFQVLRAVMQDTQDPTTCVVLDGNRQEEDILCRSDLDAYVETDSRKCTVVHTLTKGSDTWTGRRGRISKELLAEYAAPEEQSMVLVCGPGPMEKSAREILLAQGWAEPDLHFF